MKIRSGYAFCLIPLLAIVFKVPQADATPASVQTQSQPALKFVSPAVNNVLDLPSATVVLQYPKDAKVELFANGERVSDRLIGRTETSSTTITQAWYGVALKDGKNTLTAQTIVNGGKGATATIDIQVRGEAARLTVSSVESRIPADGRSTATIEGQVLDAQGNLSNRETTVTLSVTAGEFIGTDADKEQPGFQVKAQQGRFTTTLRAGLEPRAVTIQARANALEAFSQLNFETDLRPSIATGVIDLRFGRRGTDYFGRLRDFNPEDRNNPYRVDAQAVVFATGRIGTWLFTGAFNNSRTLNETCDSTARLYRDIQPCDQNYPVYGDSSSTTAITPSRDSLFLRFERTSPVSGAGIDYAMWGDFNTEEFARRSQTFTATTRQLHGFKTNYNIGNLQITGIFADNLEGFQRDTIPPDGTSGFYFLSRRLLLEGSENVFLETEELNRPGTVIDRQALSRGADYEIDYDRGSLLFRQPILRTDIGVNGETLVRRIVVTYQYQQRGSNNNLYAGRLQYNFARGLDRESWVGATYLQENQGVRQFELFGADALLRFGTSTQLIAEYAHSENSLDLGSSVRGSAYRLELNSQIAQGIFGQAYYRKTDAGFNNNATTSFTPGQTRYGAQVSATVSPTTNVRVQYDKEDNTGIAPRPLTLIDELLAPRTAPIPGSRVDNSLTTITAGIEQRFGTASFSLDWLYRDRQDRLTPAIFSGSSEQLRSRLTFPLTETLAFLAQNETTLSSGIDPVFNDRTLLGLNWQALPGVRVQLAQQFYHRRQFAGQSLTNLNVLGEHKLFRDTTLTGRYTLLGGANGTNIQAALGLNQILRISPGLRANLAYERVFSTISSRSAAGTIFAQPFAVGQSAASLGLESGDNYSIGLEYSDESRFQASARFERRTSSAGANTVISAGAAGKISPALTALFQYQQANAANQALVGLDDTKTLRLGLAYRDPNDDRFNALLRYEYRKNPSTIPDTILFGSGTGTTENLFALEAIYAPNWRWEFYGKFALRESTSYLASDLAGTSTVTLAQGRMVYRLGYRWDVAAEGRWIGQSTTGFNELGWALEAGYYLTPDLRLSAGYSFGRANDRDFTGSRSTSGLYVGVTLKVNELFNGFGLQRFPKPQTPPEQKTVMQSDAKAPSQSH
ncbi:TonB-dependent receptor [Cyanobacteria bacterium FACHB-DQ100]|nr:TonB-dependent receptor [Cyanobacteria bacterium FACHB-DQ100]